MSSQAIIKTVGLTKVFRDFWRRARVRAVNDLDLAIQPGEVFGLLGPNGSGKSTTIKMILGLLHPTRGHVSVFGRPPDNVRIKSRIGYLPEESYLYRFLNARETLEYYGTLFRLERPARKRRIEELLEMVGLRSAARRPVGEYSKGMARRIGLAQALINDPDLLILDEPTSGLDPVGSKLVKDIILRLGSIYKKTVLLSSHLLADVEEVCDRVTILYGGRERESGTLEEVLSRRDQLQIQCDRLTPETLAEIESLVQQREGKSVTVSTPRDRLESLFLRIVQRAQTEKLETAGTTAVGEIAGFLGEKETGQAVLDELLRAEPVEAVTPVAAGEEPPAEEPGVDVSVLGDLTSEPETAPAAVPTAGTAA
ncbi:MAG: ABC transporter ATP-binding protein, partial [Phycisphaerae bacterium]|nr:ABC transporter ATP-binding protein [Phycisphaerae bacterium]